MSWTCAQNVDRVHNPGYSQRILGETIRRLDAISEAGCRLGLEAHRGWFEQSRRGAYDSGLTSLAMALDSLANQSMFPARAILQARYLTHLHMQAMGHVPVSYTHLDVYKRQATLLVANGPSKS